MNRILVWDLPTRVLHWVFALALVVALGIGFAVDDEDPLFAYHMLAGLVAGFALFARLVMGIVGSRYARFSSWAWSPRALRRYVVGLLDRNAVRDVSHNPANTWVSAAMFGVVALLIATGVFAGRSMEEPHEVLAAVLIGAIVLHLLGLAWHTVRHRENIALAMVDGRKVGPADAGIREHHAFAGVLILAATLGWAGALVQNYDASAGRVRLPLAGITLQLTESGSNHDEHQERRERH